MRGHAGDKRPHPTRRVQRAEDDSMPPAPIYAWTANRSKRPGGWVIDGRGGAGCLPPTQSRALDDEQKQTTLTSGASGAGVCHRPRAEQHIGSPSSLSCMSPKCRPNIRHAHRRLRSKYAWYARQPASKGHGKNATSGGGARMARGRWWWGPTCRKMVEMSNRQGS